MTPSKIFLIGFCLISVLIGIWRYQVLELRAKNYELRKYNDLEEEITLIGTVVKEPDIRETNTKLTIEVRPPLFSGGRTSAKLLVTVNRYPEYQYGDELKITGKLQTPPAFEDFNYKNYLKNKGIYSVMYLPKIELLSRGNYKGLASFFYSKVLEFKDKLRQSVYSSLPPAQSYILGAMILGDKNRMPHTLKEKLNISGLRHITAVSGLHIVLLSSVLMSLLIGLGFWRHQAFYISVVFLFLFIILTGFQVSSIRAGIMGGLCLLGQKIGRRSASSRSIFLAGTVMLAVNPLLLKDVGFQLSFLAALGIISLAPFFKNWVRSNILAMTFSAYLFTLPILIYNFNRVSLAAPITNVLVLPFLQWIMISGFIFALGGIFFPSLGLILSLPSWLLLTYVVKVVDFFSVSWLAKGIENVSWFWLIVFYLILGILVWYIKKRERFKFLNY